MQNKCLPRYQIVLLVISPALALACGVLGNNIVDNQQINQCPPIPTPMPSNLRPNFQGQIAFSISCGYPGNTGDIFMMNADGTGVINLTDRPGDDLLFSWSPNGHYMAFTSDKNGKYDIYLLNKGSNAVTRLTDNIADDRAPLWSPNGRLIAFISNRDSTTTEERSEVYVMKPDGSQQTRISGINVRLDSSTRWSPDSLKLATEINGEIYILYLDGSASQNVTNNLADDFEPAWSPDGSNILFISNRDGHGNHYHWELYVLHLNSGQVTPLGPVHDFAPRWSPDGKKVLFSRWVNYANQDVDLFTINVDGTNLINITNNPVTDMHGEWSPDGKYISFLSGRDPGGLYVMNSDGTQHTSFLWDFYVVHKHEWIPTENTHKHLLM